MVESAGLPVGHEAVDHFDAGVGHQRHRSGRPEVDVVRMGGDDEHPFDLREVEHRNSQRRNGRDLNMVP